MTTPKRPLVWADRILMDRSATLRPSRLDAVMRCASRVADHGVLWWLTAGLLAVAGGRARRGAVRGLLSLAFASGFANGILKPLFPRRRPPARGWVAARRGVPIPSSSSFPSGHAASAAAFAAGVALESPRAGAVVAPIAVAVAYSRIHNGVHWPTDVLAGLAVGGAIASSTRRWWAIRQEEPATLGPASPAPGLPGGEGMLLIVNRESGDGGDELVDQIAAALPHAHIHTLAPTEDFTTQLDQRISALHPRGLGVCGGDGTVVAAADAASRHGLPLAVFPGGTLNHFARDVGITSVRDTADAVESGQAVLVDRATVDIDSSGPAPFLNTSSLGGYPDAVRLREAWEPRIGKWPAAGAAMVRILAAAEPLTVTLDGRRVAVWMLFVGNGRYSPSDQVPMSRPDLNKGLLDVRYLRADRRFSRLRLLISAATGTLGASPVYVRRLATTLSVRVESAAVALATDGEVVADAHAFDFISVPGALAVYRRPAAVG